MRAGLAGGVVGDGNGVCGEFGRGWWEDGRKIPGWWAQSPPRNMYVEDWEGAGEDVVRQRADRCPMAWPGLESR